MGDWTTICTFKLVQVQLAVLQTFWGETTGAGVGGVSEMAESPDDPEGATVSVFDEPPEACGAPDAGDDDDRGTSVDDGNGTSGINVRSDAGRDVSIINGGRAF